MQRLKLISKRHERNKTQEEVADFLGMTQSQYSRRECGITKITKIQWDKLAVFLNTDLQSIFENQNDEYFEDCNLKISEMNSDVNSNFAMDIMKKYIAKLEEENKALKLLLIRD